MKKDNKKATMLSGNNKAALLYKTILTHKNSIAEYLN